MSLVLRVEYRPQPNMSDEKNLILAADNMVALATHFPDMVFTIVELVASVQGHDMFAHPSSTRDSVLKMWHEAATSKRSTAYVCEHCQVSSSKVLWGPGRITCPRCGKMANAADGTPRP
jgi:uncharacterized paraquat-inducible protein A